MSKIYKIIILFDRSFYKHIIYLLICFKIGTGVGLAPELAGPEYPGWTRPGAGRGLAENSYS